MSLLTQPGFRFEITKDFDNGTWSAQLQVDRGWVSQKGFPNRSDAWNWVFGLVGQHYPDASTRAQRVH